MRAALFLTGIFLLAGCGRGDNGAHSPRENGPVAKARIVEQRDEQPAASASSPVRTTQAPAPALITKDSPPSSETHYRAIGTEPFWAVTVKGSTATLERPDKPPIRFPIARTDDGRALRYISDGFAMTVTDGPCSDGMSDATWADRVSIAFGEGTLKGCGGAREDF